MRFGLQVYSFTWPGGPQAIGPTLARVVRSADEAGFDSIWVMDHFWQIGAPGSETEPMLEGWTALGFMAAHTQRARLGLMVGGVHYRNPGLWVKAATTLDVLSGGRAWLGLGAGWNQAESVGLGFPFPATKTRFEMLEDTLRIAHNMFEGDRGSETRFEGRQFTAERLLNVPQSISRPRVPIMIGGGGEKKTLLLVARYADASNLFGDPDQLRHKYRILAEHCEAVGRPYEEIERTTLQSVSLFVPNTWRTSTESADQLVDRFGRLGDAGVQQVIINTADVHNPDVIELLATEVMPHLAESRSRP
ncbi:MAG: LLM class F420-dependent oxidoreductase [Acidimicrobiia bacterium]